MHISEPEEQHHFPAHPLTRTAPPYTLPCKGTASGNTVPRITAEGGGAARSPAVQPCPPHRHLGTALRAFDPALLPPLPALPSPARPPARVPAYTPVNIAPRAGTDATSPAPGRADRGSPHSPPRTPHSPPELPSLRLRGALAHTALHSPVQSQLPSPRPARGAPADPSPIRAPLTAPRSAAAKRGRRDSRRCADRCSPPRCRCPVSSGGSSGRKVSSPNSRGSNLNRCSSP